MLNPLRTGLLTGLILTLPLPALQAQTLNFTGTAYEPDTSAVQYREQHELQLTDGEPERQTVRYEDPNGRLLATKTLRYTTPTLPSYRLELETDEQREVVELSDDTIEVRGRETGNVEVPDDNAVIDAGFHYFVQRHFDRLVAGERIEFQFLAPSRLKWTPLVMEAIDTTDSRLELKLSLENALIAWIIDPIYLVYDRRNQRLLEYRGLTNLPKPDGGNYTARIEYSYE